MTDPSVLSATDAIAAVKSGVLTAEEWVRSCVDVTMRSEPQLQSWVQFDGDYALTQARAIDEAIRRGTFAGRLYGAPVGVKDVFNTRDFPTQMGSPIWSGFTPGNDARVVAHLRMEGAVVPGKTVTAEFAVHHPGPTVNPHDASYSPGTSSSGSAVAVAARMVPLALGTQTAGSTIRPASYCGIYGFKPSFGVVPRTGILKTLDTLDHVAFFARGIEDLTLLFDCARVRGHNHPQIARTLDAWTPESIRLPLRIGLVRGPVWDEAEPYAREALVTLASAWASDDAIHLGDAELPAELADAHAVHDRVYTKALSYYFRDEYVEHRDQLSDSFRDMCDRGVLVTTAQYREDLATQRAMQHALDRMFERYDLLLCLSTAGSAPKGRFGREKRDSCLIWTLCHVPAINIPVFRGPSGLPFGAQLVARRYEDLFLLHAVHRLRECGRIVDWVAQPVSPASGD